MVVEQELLDKVLVVALIPLAVLEVAAVQTQ
jgi:hypothetical protein